MNSKENKEQQSSKSPMDLTWQDTDQLRAYTTGTGKILPRKITRLTAKQQRHITKTIKRSRNMLQLM